MNHHQAYGSSPAGKATGKAPKPRVADERRKTLYPTRRVVRAKPWLQDNPPLL